ncbi:hypothetical protein B0H16DRAFT_1438827 [Mycena metata]|uniref:F-box domain-containing protein n=1 Tax=Mycena metata TaxID=1033252 RepID=A0AAD7M9Q3_9AGAR|nr:hypothetical protein B0H16DRAFT_1438827 [Mycena metata]
MATQAGTESIQRQPTQSERNSLASDRARRAVIKAKILELERSLSSLKEEDDLLQDRLDAYTYPVLTLPNEIVSEIFIHFLPVYPHPPPIIGRSSPNVLGQICRKWREIAFGTPTLWRAISLSLRNGKRLDQKLRLLELWLKRSGSCLLSIYMAMGDDIRPVFDSFIQAIAAHSGRWEHVRLYSPINPFPIDAHLPFLRTLTTFGSADGALGADSLVGAIHAAPLLHSLPNAPLLRNLAVLFWRDRSLFLYPWSQLTVFDGYFMSPHQCVDVLAHASNLVYCNFDVCMEHNNVLEISRRITAPCLETFILRVWTDYKLSCSFLDIFTLPALQRLQVAEPLLGRKSAPDSLKSLIARSGCDVQKLDLYITESEESPDLYRHGFPTARSLVFNNPLDVVNPFLVPQDEENAELSNGGLDTNARSGSHSNADDTGSNAGSASDSEEEGGSDESD